MKSQRSEGALALVFLALLVGLFFRELICDGLTFVAPDVLTPAASDMGLSRAQANTGEHPLWSPYLFGGMPTLGTLLYVPDVYFPDILQSWLAPWGRISFETVLVLHYLLAGFGTYLFARRLGVGAMAAVFSAVAFMLNPTLVTMSTQGHGSQLMSTAYLPVVLWAVDRALASRTPASVALMGLCVGLLVQCRHPQIAYYGMALVVSWVVAGGIAALRSEGRAAVGSVVGSGARTAGALLIAGCLSAQLILPVLEYKPYSIRGASSLVPQLATELVASEEIEEGRGVGLEYATRWSFAPVEALTFAVPSLFGFGGDTYWGQMPFTDHPNYAGWFTLLLALLGAAGRAPGSRFLLCAGLVGTVLSFGRHTPVYALAYEWLPLFDAFRVPSLVLVVVHLMLALLAGFGLERVVRVLERGDRFRCHRATLLWFAVAILGVGAAVWLLRDPVAAWVAELSPARFSAEIEARLDARRVELLLRDFLSLAFFSVAALAAGAAAIQWHYYARAPQIFAAVVVGLTVADLWRIDVLLYEPLPRGEVQRFLRGEGVLESLAREEGVFRVFPAHELFPDVRFAAHGIETIGGYHAAKPRSYQDLMEASGLATGFLRKYYRETTLRGRKIAVPRSRAELPERERHRDLRLLNLLNVKYVLSLHPVDEPRFRLRQRMQDGGGLAEGRVLYVYENRDALPRPYLVGDYERIRDPVQALRRLLSNDFDPRTSVILEGDPHPKPAEDPSAQVLVRKHELDHWEVEVASREPQLLVFADNHYPPGWGATIDSASVPILRADFAFRAVAVPAGSHVVRLEMRAPGYRLGRRLLWLGLGALLLLTFPAAMRKVLRVARVSAVK